MRLQTTFDIFAWYDHVRELGKPIIWCSAFAPAEVLLAAGLMPVYPENHAAMLGALSPDRNPNNPWSAQALNASEEAGYGDKFLCSYALSDIGSLLIDNVSPINGLPAPDAFYACTSQCSVVERWGNEVQALAAAQGKEIPHYVLHAPPLRGEQHTEEELQAFAHQLRGHVRDMCERFSLQYDEARLYEIVRESNAANKLWQECLECAKTLPTPWTSFDAFTAMAPIVIARGTALCTAFYRDLLQELKQRIAEQQQAVPKERVRLLWDAIPIWPRKNWFAQTSAAAGAAFVTSTYTHSWWFHFDEEKPFAAIVERYAWNTMNRSGKWVLDWTKQLVEDYQVQGIVTHWNNSCGIWNSYVKRRLRGFEEAGIPCLRIDADMVDARYFNEEQVQGDLFSFIDRCAERCAL